MYIGMDVHRKRSQVAVLNDHGDEVLNRNVANEPGALVPILTRFPAGTPVVFEAGYGWSWLVDLLEETGFEVHMAHAGRCKAIASARLKNDRVDARILAHLLRTQLLAEAWIAPKEIRDLRALLRHRAALVRMRTTLKHRIHTILADCGIQRTDRLWSRSGKQYLVSLSLPSRAREIIDDCLNLIEAVTIPIGRLEATIRAQVKPDPRAHALQALPGIGPLTALTLLAEIGTIARFPTARKLCAWAGLTPTVRNSDRKVRHGGISKQGSVWVRAALGEAAQKARLHPLFSRSYATIAHRRGRNIATVAIARKLLARCFHILKDLEADKEHNAGEGLRAG
jgi:transposase